MQPGMSTPAPLPAAPGVRVLPHPPASPASGRSAVHPPGTEMAPDEGRCAACGSRVGPGAQWCSLCFAPLGTAAATGVPGVPAPDVQDPAAEVAEPPPATPAEESAPGDGPGVPDPQALLAALATAERAGSRALPGMPSSAAGRAGAAFLGAVAFVAAGTALLAVLGLVL